FNPFCGDHLVLYLKVNESVIEDISFKGELCAISKASASMMTEKLKGMNFNEALKVLDNIELLLDAAILPGGIRTPEYGELAALSLITNSPARVKCAWLPWKTVRNAMSNREVLL
ncbi:MAG: Fe-S cluster assembly sulfur transfer protein SufU, partial [Methanococcaceae archaeon]